MRQIKDIWPWWRRAGLIFDRRKRQAFRLFKTFPLARYDTVVDLGAFRGEFTDAVLATMAPTRVVLIEADPQSAERLRRRYADHHACSVIHAAVTNRAGPVKLKINQERDTSSLLPIAEATGRAFGKDLGEVEEVEVEGATLDALFEEHGLSSVDLLKVDIQGAEGMMIEGGQRALQAVRSLYIEVCFDEFYEGSPGFQELHDLITAAGFKLRSLHECRLGTDGCLAYANALYLRTDGHFA